MRTKTICADSTVLAIAIACISLATLNTCGKDAPEQAYVAADGGLRLRAAPALEAKRILTIPNGAGVEILEKQEKTIEVAGRRGKWMRVRFEEQEGWAFGGFLIQLGSDDGSDPFATPDSTPPSGDCANLEDRWGAVRSRRKSKPGGPEGTEMEHSRTVTKFANGARIVEDQYYEGATVKYEFPPGSDLRTAFESARDCGVFAEFSINRQYDWPPVAGSGTDEEPELIEWSVTVEEADGRIQKIRIEEASGPFATIQVYESGEIVIVEADVGV